jgi:rubrerythrin
MELVRKKEKMNSRSVIECQQCGERLFMPEWSESLEGGRVRHLWRCDVCDYTFETTIRFATPEYATEAQ